MPAVLLAVSPVPDSFPLAALLSTMVRLSWTPMSTSLTLAVVNGLIAVVSCVACPAAASPTLITGASFTAVALIVLVIEVVSPAVSKIVAVIGVVTTVPGAKTTPSRAFATAAAELLIVMVPLLTVLPSAALLGSEMLPLAAVPPGTTAVSVWPRFGSRITTPLKGVAEASSVVATAWPFAIAVIGTASCISDRVLVVGTALSTPSLAPNANVPVVTPGAPAVGV